jgi:isoleucyl-tRNA synthetase
MLGRNGRVDWHPEEVGAGRFGAWLENNIDWAVSRDRYWGTPLPVWVNDADPDERQVVGSYDELARLSGRALGADFDPHKPFIDDYTWPAPSGTGTMRRVPEVIDTWFDSGSMPFAQWHYPFENASRRAAVPGRLHRRGRGPDARVVLLAARDRDRAGRRAANNGAAPPPRAPAPRRTRRGGEQPGARRAGKKMSKSVGNTVDPWGVVERHGADAARLFLVAASQVWMERRFDEDALREMAGRFLVTLKNTYTGSSRSTRTSAGSPRRRPRRRRPAAARPLGLSRLSATEASAHAHLTAYDAFAAARLAMEFFDEDVSKWYVRLSRARFYDVGEADNRAAFATLHEVLTVVCRLLAPFAPFVTDWMHRELAGASVHLAPYVRPDGRGDAQRDEPLERAMGTSACSPRWGAPRARRRG